MNRDEAKKILQLYRPGTADATDPQMAEALALVKKDAELSRWLDENCARHDALRGKLKEIQVPAGLLEQIISEQTAQSRGSTQRRNAIVAVAAVAAILIAVVISVQNWLVAHPRKDFSFTTYRNQMAVTATSGYGMSLLTNDLFEIRAYLSQNGAPADYVLPTNLEKTAVAGCAVENWNGEKVSMICFRTGRPLPAGQSSDLWLFVVDRSSLKHAPDVGSTEFAAAGSLLTAVWSHDGKLYLLGVAGDESEIRKFL